MKALQPANNPQATKEIRRQARALGLRVFSDKGAIKIKPEVGERHMVDLIDQIAELCRATLPEGTWARYTASASCHNPTRPDYKLPAIRIRD
jgi:hypothetical protein